jgi:hypothetical protein
MTGGAPRRYVVAIPVPLVVAKTNALTACSLRLRLIVKGSLSGHTSAFSQSTRVFIPRTFTLFPYYLRAFSGKRKERRPDPNGLLVTHADTGHRQ